MISGTTKGRYTLPVFTGGLYKKHCTGVILEIHERGPSRRPVFTVVRTQYSCPRNVVDNDVVIMFYLQNA